MPPDGGQVEGKGGPLGLGWRLWWLLGVAGVILVIAIVFLVTDGDNDGEGVSALDTTTTAGPSHSTSRNRSPWRSTRPWLVTDIGYVGD